MSDEIEAVLRDHYRRAAEDIRPDAALIDRCRRAGRPARALPLRPVTLLSAAMVAAVVLTGALVAWRLSRPADRDVPVAPPGRTGQPIGPGGLAPRTEPPSPVPSATPSATPSGAPASVPRHEPRPTGIPRHMVTATPSGSPRAVAATPGTSSGRMPVPHPSPRTAPH